MLPKALRLALQMPEEEQLNPSKKEVINQVLFLQMKIQRSMRDDAPDAWLALNLSIAQLKSLFFINFEGVTNFKNLATALGVTPPNVTGIIERLVEHDLVSREYNQANRRMQMLKLTPKGVNLVTGLKERTTSHLSRLLENLSSEDLSALVQGLTALARGVQRDQETESIKLNEKELSRRLPAV
jgi:DNA-binding MarR family transcriptional regulator